MTDFKYNFKHHPAKRLAYTTALLALGMTVLPVATYAQNSDLQLNETLLDDGRAQTSNPITPPTTPPPAFPSVTEPQPESRGVQPIPRGLSNQPLFRGPVGASDRLFSGPVDPDTQDDPGAGNTGAGGGARIGLPRTSGEIQPGQRDDRRVTPGGRIVRRGEAGYDTASPISANANQDPNAGRLFQSIAIDADIDPDLRNTFDDDLEIRDPLLMQEPLTGPTIGASRLQRSQRILSTLDSSGFTSPRRQDFPSIDDDRPYDPLGIRMGSFRFLPTLTTTSIATDNVFNAPGNAETDIGLELRPTLRIESDWNRHSFTVDATGTAVFYNEFNSENTEQFAVTARGRIDMTLRTNLELDAGYQLTTEQRGSANSSAGAIEQPDVKTWQVGATLNHRFNRLVTRTRLGYTEEINGDAQLVGGGVDLGSDEDSSGIDIASRLTYEFSPSFAAFVEGGYNRQTFDTVADADGILRDSDGYEIHVGMTREFGPAIRGEISVGYATQISDDARLADVEGFVFDADILWRPTALTSINLTAQSEINASTLSGSLGSLTYQTALNVRHEFRRYAIGTLGFGWRHEDFQGSSISEDEFVFQLGGEYLFSRNLAALASYQYTDFNSSLPASDYNTNEFRLGLQLRR